MILGQLLDGKGNATSMYFSPWFPRGGNQAEFTCQVFASAELSSFEIAVETKNSEDADNEVTTIGSATTITLGSPPVSTTWSVGANLSSANQGFLELVRFRYEITSGSATDEPWVHFRMLNPTWLSN